MNSKIDKVLTRQAPRHDRISGHLLTVLLQAWDKAWRKRLFSFIGQHQHFAV